MRNDSVLIIFFSIAIEIETVIEHSVNVPLKSTIYLTSTLLESQKSMVRGRYMEVEQVAAAASALEATNFSQSFGDGLDIHYIPLIELSYYI